MPTTLPTIPPEDQNVSFGERGLSVLVGLAVAAAAVKPRPSPLLKVAALAVGCYLAFRGATGYCPIKANLDRV